MNKDRIDEPEISYYEVAHEILDCARPALENLPPTASSADHPKPLIPDLQSVREDLNSIKSAIAELVSRKSAHAVNTAREAASNVVSQVTGAGTNVVERTSEIAAAASQRAGNFAAGAETLGRCWPAL